MPKLLISYRRSDSDAMAGRIRDNLAAYYGNESVFIDVDNIPFGTDFREHIRKAFGDHDLMIAVVGQKWLGPRKAGRTRMQEETDPVRVEIEMALQQKMPVVPVLVNNARMPKPEDLPSTIKNFSFLNAAEVESGRDFRTHMDRLIRSIDGILGLKPAISGKSPSSLHSGRAKYWIIAAVVLVVVAAVGVFAARPLQNFIVGVPVDQTSDTGIDFASIPAETKPVAARPYLNKAGISVTNVTPAGSEIVFFNNRGMYEGGAALPTKDQIFLTQRGTGNVPASYTLEFAKPVAWVSFTRPSLYAATPSGVTHPRWKVTALGPDGQELSSQSEGLLRKMKDPGDDIVPARTHTLVSVGFEGIVAIRIDSDPQLNGKPFAGFDSLLIERLTYGGSKSNPPK